MASAWDTLRAAWNGAQQPPAGVTGTGLTSSMTTEEKLAAVNAWLTAGPSRAMVIPTYKIYNAIVPSEFTSLTNAQQQLVRDILSMGQVDASPGTSVRARMVALFPDSTQTFANFAALAQQYDTTKVSWLVANGYPEKLGLGDLEPSAANLT